MLIKTPKPNHFFHLLDYASVCWGLFLNVAFEPSFLVVGRPDWERANDTSLPLVLSVSLVLLISSS